MKLLKLTATMLALSFTGMAPAAPIQFDFSGFVHTASAGHEDWTGQRATGRFLIETDNFTVLPTPAPQTTWTDALPIDARPQPITASISIGSDLISLNTDVETYGGIHFITGCPTACFPGWRENWTISGNSQSIPLIGPLPTGSYSRASLTFSSLGPVEADFVPDWALMPVDILTLPFGELFGSYNAWEFVCGENVCTQTSYTTAQFRVDSVMRTLVDPTPVPEPATLGLLGAGLFGMFAARRRRV